MKEINIRRSCLTFLLWLYILPWIWRGEAKKKYTPIFWWFSERLWVTTKFIKLTTTTRTNEHADDSSQPTPHHHRRTGKKKVVFVLRPCWCLPDVIKGIACFDSSLSRFTEFPGKYFFFLHRTHSAVHLLRPSTPLDGVNVFWWPRKKANVEDELWVESSRLNHSGLVYYCNLLLLTCCGGRLGGEEGVLCLLRCHSCECCSVCWL